MPPRAPCTPIAFALISTACLAAQPPAPPTTAPATNTPAAPATTTIPAYADPAAWAAATDITQLRALRDQLLATPDAPTRVVRLLTADETRNSDDAQAVLSDAFTRLGPATLDAVLESDGELIYQINADAWMASLTPEQAKRVVDTYATKPSFWLSLLPLVPRLYAKGIDVTPAVIQWMESAHSDALLNNWQFCRGDHRLSDAGKAQLKANKIGTAYYMFLAADPVKDQEIVDQALAYIKLYPKSDNVVQALFIAARHAPDPKTVTQAMLARTRERFVDTQWLLQVFAYLDMQDPEIRSAFMHLAVKHRDRDYEPNRYAKAVWKTIGQPEVDAFVNQYATMPLSDRAAIGGVFAYFDNFATQVDAQLARDLDAVDVKAINAESSDLSILKHADPSRPLAYAAALRLYGRAESEGSAAAFDKVANALIDSLDVRAIKQSAKEGTRTIRSHTLPDAPQALIDSMPRELNEQTASRVHTLLRALPRAKPLPLDLRPVLLQVLKRTQSVTAYLDDIAAHTEHLKLVNSTPLLLRAEQEERDRAIALTCLSKFDPIPGEALDWLIDNAFAPPPPVPPPQRPFGLTPRIDGWGREPLLLLATRIPAVWDHLDLRRHNFVNDFLTLIGADNPGKGYLFRAGITPQWSLPESRMKQVLDSPRLNDPANKEFRARLTRYALVLGHRDEQAIANARAVLTSLPPSENGDEEWAAIGLIAVKEPGAVEFVASLLDDERPRIRSAAYRGLARVSDIKELTPARPKLLTITSGPFTHPMYGQAALLLITLDGESPEVLAMISRLESDKDPQLAALGTRMRAYLKKKAPPTEAKP